MKSEREWNFDLAADKPTDDVVVVNISSSVTTKAELFNAYEVSLGLPEYFGSNWDAFEECVRDLSWVPTKNIVLFHESLPFADHPDMLKTYLSILADVTEKWLKKTEHGIHVYFAKECEATVRKILGN